MGDYTIVAEQEAVRCKDTGGLVSSSLVTSHVTFYKAWPIRASVYLPVKWGGKVLLLLDFALNDRSSSLIFTF